MGRYIADGRPFREDVLMSFDDFPQENQAASNGQNTLKKLYLFCHSRMCAVFGNVMMFNGRKDAIMNAAITMIDWR